MATVVNNPPTHEHEGSGTGLFVGIMVAILVIVLFFVFGRAAFRDSGTQINVPDKIEVDVTQ